jgi:hypothetical protein
MSEGSDNVLGGGDNTNPPIPIQIQMEEDNNAVVEEEVPLNVDNNVDIEVNQEAPQPNNGPMFIMDLLPVIEPPQQQENGQNENHELGLDSSDEDENDPNENVQNDFVYEDEEVEELWEDASAGSPSSRK